MELGILRGVAAYRWGAWAWMATVVLLSRREFERPGLAYALVAAALVLTAVVTALLRSDPDALRRPEIVGAELLLASGLVLVDGWVHAPGEAFTGQSVGVAWPLAGVLATGIAGGAWIGAASGLLLGAANLGSNLVNGITTFSDAQVVSLASTTVLYALAGGVTGHVTRLLRGAEREVSRARAREEVAQRLHDGVLQTLAVIERRADDPVLAGLAREQEHELRAWIAGAERPETAGLGSALRRVAARFENVYGGRVQVVVADDLETPGAESGEALVGAVGEALQNAGKHGGAERVTVFVEPDGSGGVFCAVKDDGTGFDPGRVPEGMGLRSSVRGRIAEVGGRVEVESRPGGPTEVRIWVP